MKFVPSLWGASSWERFRAIALGIFLAAGLATGVHRGSLIAVAVWTVLITVTLASWIQDFVRAIRGGKE
jgi:hypothetical protein